MTPHTCKPEPTRTPGLMICYVCGLRSLASEHPQVCIPRVRTTAIYRVPDEPPAVLDDDGDDPRRDDPDRETIDTRRREVQAGWSTDRMRGQSRQRSELKPISIDRETRKLVGL